MKNNFFLYLCITVTSINTLYGSFDKKVMIGTVQFPKSVKNAQPMRIYCGGKIISSEVDTETRRLVFSLSEHKYKSYFYLLIAQPEHINFDLEDNTVKSLRLNPDSPYKFYTLEYVSHKDKNSTWIVKEVTLTTETKIPDETIILCYNPDYIDKLVGGSTIEFPKIMVRDDILNLVGSETALHEQSSKLLLSSLDYDALHQTISYSVKQELRFKTIIALER